MQGKTIRTETTRERFLAKLSETGNVTETCALTNINRPTVYAWRNSDESFARAWDAALELGADAMEDEARRRALAGSDALMVFMLRALRPERYRERTTVDVNNRTMVDYRTMSVDELRARLADLRSKQDAPPVLTLVADQDEV